MAQPPPLGPSPFQQSEGIVAVVSPLPALKESPSLSSATPSSRCNGGGLITFKQRALLDEEDPSLAYSVRTSL